MLIVAAMGGCATETVRAPDQAELPCGLRDCSVAEDDGTTLPALSGDSALGGKADSEDVVERLGELTEDGVLDGDDVAELFDETGRRVSISEMQAIRDAVVDPKPLHDYDSDGTRDDYEVTEDAIATATKMALVRDLFDYEQARIADAESLTVGGHEVPEAVRELLARARLNGAVAYDVRETNEEGEGVWNPYPSTAPPLGPMAFDYTEITPEVLAEDMATEQTFTRFRGEATGTATTASQESWEIPVPNCVGPDCTTYLSTRVYNFNADGCDPESDWNCGHFATYELVTAFGSGSVESNYDHIYHPDIFARGRSSNQKWANNCAILSDGTLHCLPAMRRSVLRDLILTNPHLSRCNDLTYEDENGDDQLAFPEACQHLLYHGHVSIRGGVVTSVEVSGRLSRRIAQGDAVIVDPVALFEAWGFEISPYVRFYFGNTSDGVPVRSAERGVVTAAPANIPE